MRLTKPRIEPLAVEELDDESRAAFAQRPLNIFCTLARHPKLLKRWMVFGNHVLNKSSLPPRERELVILRVGWLCQAGYEWGQHVAIGRAAGLGDEEIERIADGPEAAGWSELDRLLRCDAPGAPPLELAIEAAHPLGGGPEGVERAAGALRCEERGSHDRTSEGGDRPSVDRRRRRGAPAVATPVFDPKR